MKKPKSPSDNDKPKKTRKLNAAVLNNIERMKRGEIVSPGRPKGARSKFSETFVRDFMENWEKNGQAAMDRCAKTDPASYIRVAATLVPKDFNLNVSNEAEIGRLLDKFSLDQLESLARGLELLGAGRKPPTIEGEVRDESDCVH